jgi:hypothetical protein
MLLRRQFLALLAVPTPFVSASAQPHFIVRVSALANGKLLLDGTPATLQELDAALRKLKQANGVVWYYRENAQAEPPPQAIAAVKLIVDHSLPVSMSSKSDFSDYVDASGQSKPRGKP